VVIVIGLLVGALNGILVTRVGLPSFITTLGMLALLRGATNVVSSGYPIPAKNTALPFYQIILANLPGTHVPNMFVAMLVVVLIGGVILATTRFGSHVYATGGNLSAARNAGIDVARVKFRCFDAMGGLCALAAIILFGRWRR
jgi:ribose transport system permease protein